MSEREWRFYLDDMIGFAQNVLNYVADMDQNKFVTSKLNHYLITVVVISCGLPRNL